MKVLSFRASLLLLAAMCSAPSWAVAQTPSARDASSAEALFESGRDALNAGDLELACGRFAESLRLDPAPGTLLNLAVCEQRRQRWSAAWQHYRHLLEWLDVSDPRNAAAREQLQRVEAQLAWVTLVVPPDWPREARVRRHGTTLGAASFGVALPTDPGLVRLEVEAPGHEPRLIVRTLTAGERAEVVLELGAAKAPSKTLAQGPLARTRSPNGVAQSRNGVAQSPNGVALAPRAVAPAAADRTGPYLVFGVAAAAIVSGAVLGYAVHRAKVDYDAHCNEQYRCDDEGLAAADRGERLSLWSTLSFAVGFAGAAAGAYWFVSQSRPDANAATMQARFSF